MGQVLLGVLVGPEGFETPVVLKRILPEFSGDDSFRTMFRNEAKALVSVRHPNVVQLYELGSDHNELFLVMEYLEGESVTSVLRAVRHRSESMPLDFAVQVVAQAAAGLHAAHEQRADDGSYLGLVHRDVSPQNIFLTYDGIAKIIDFGIAKHAEQPTKTKTGQLKGKYGYMAPEQFKSQQLDRRTDIFALGVVLYELTTGRRLFRRDSLHATMNAICEETVPTPTLPSGEPFPLWLDAVLQRALQRDPEDRYATAADMRRDLLLGLRELDPENTLEERLRTRMHELFADRIEAKRAMLSAAAEGSFSTAPEAELPSLTMARSGRASDARPARGWILVGSLGLLALGAAIMFAVLDREPEASAPVPSPVVVAPGVPATAQPVAPVEPQEHELVVDSEPEGATVRIDGARIGDTPVRWRCERESCAVQIRVERAGFVTLEEALLVSDDLRVRYTLRPQRRAAPSGFGRFD